MPLISPTRRSHQGGVLRRLGVSASCHRLDGVGALALGLLVIAACAPRADTAGVDAPFVAVTDGMARARAEGHEARLVPVGRDPDGCLMYRLGSPDGRTLDAITYRRPNGRVTFYREEADCALPEGADAGRGVPRQAEPG